MRSHLKVYFNFEEDTQALNDSEKGRLLLAMVRYAKDGEVMSLTGNERFLFPVFKAQIDRDIETYEIKISNGSKGGRPKTEDNQEKPNETENNLDESKKTEIPKIEDRRKKIEDRRIEKELKEKAFDRFWESYPRKEAKPTAKKAFEKLNPDEVLLKTMLEAIQRFKETSQWQEENGRFIPHPATWLNQRRWEDDIPKAKTYGKKTVHAQDYEQRDYSGEEETMEEVLERLTGMGMIE